MLTAVLIITSILLSVAALWLAHARTRASGRWAAGELGGLREWLGRELSELRGGLESERQSVERQGARLEALAAAQEEARRELEAVRERATQRSLAASDEEAAANGDSGPDDSRGETEAAVETNDRDEPADVYALARGMEEFFNATTHPRELLGHETFRRGVELSLSAEQTTHGLLSRATASSDMHAASAS